MFILFSMKFKIKNSRAHCSLIGSESIANQISEKLIIELTQLHESFNSIKSIFFSHFSFALQWQSLSTPTKLTFIHRKRHALQLIGSFNFEAESHYLQNKVNRKNFHSFKRKLFRKLKVEISETYYLDRTANTNTNFECTAKIKQGSTFTFQCFNVLISNKYSFCENFIHKSIHFISFAILCC